MIDILAYVYFSLNLLSFSILGYKAVSKIRSKENSIFNFRNSDDYKFDVIIPAWQEGKTLEETISKIDEVRRFSNFYDVKIHVATYPNDSKTLRSIESAKKRVDSLDVILNSLNGPTTKAQNLSYSLKEISRMQNPEYIIILDAEVYPTKDYFAKLSKNINKKDSKTVYQTKVVAFPFKSKSLFEDLIGRTYFISQSYIQWLIDSGRKDLGKSILLKGAGMIFPKDSLDDIIEILEKENDGYLGQFTRLVEDTKLSLELRERDYNIRFINDTYTVEDSPGSLKVAFKRYKRWFKGNFAILWKYKRQLIKYFPHYFVVKIASATTPLVYVGFISTVLSSNDMPHIVALVNYIASIYYLTVPPLVATLGESKVFEIKNHLNLEEPISYVKEYLKNVGSTAIGYFLSPLVAIAGYWDIIKGNSKWYKTERD